MSCRALCLVVRGALSFLALCLVMRGVFFFRASQSLQLSDFEKVLAAATLAQHRVDPEVLPH